jgi:hypothetical protein
MHVGMQAVDAGRHSPSQLSLWELKQSSVSFGYLSWQSLQQKDDMEFFPLGEDMEIFPAG